MDRRLPLLVLHHERDAPGGVPSPPVSLKRVSGDVPQTLGPRSHVAERDRTTIGVGGADRRDLDGVFEFGAQVRRQRCQIQAVQRREQAHRVLRDFRHLNDISERVKHGVYDPPVSQRDGYVGAVLWDGEDLSLVLSLRNSLHYRARRRTADDGDVDFF